MSLNHSSSLNIDYEESSMRMKELIMSRTALISVILFSLWGSGGLLPSTIAQESKAIFFYKEWQKAEGIPVYEVYYANALKLELKPWKRLGVLGAYVDLKGCQGLDNVVVMEIAPGQSTKAERHLFEESIYVLSGEGETEVWQDGGKKQVVKWKKGSLFSPPLNTWHRHYNRGTVPIRLMAVTNAPAILDIYHSADFVYNCDYKFTDRYSGENDYFTRREQIDPQLFMFKGGRFGITVTNLIEDVKQFPLKRDDLKGASMGYPIMSDNLIGPHLAKWEAGTYQAAHAHGPGAVINIIEGKGYSLMWPKEAGTKPFTGGHKDQVIRVDWEEGTIFAPPDLWFHQHFNTGKSTAIYLAHTFAGKRYAAEVMGALKALPSSISLKKGGTLIPPEEEDSILRQMFLDELKRSGVTLRPTTSSKTP
jgi:oxalate decarboxylase/phosphoglucose isomerase-like protein (cupin superfamily)